VTVDQELLPSIPPQQRLLSWYGHVNDVSTLTERFEQLAASPAALYKIVTTAVSIAEEFLPLTLLNTLQRDDTIAFANGPLGFWNRIVALQLGSPAIFGAVGAGSVVDMEPSISKLIDDYELPLVEPVSELFDIIGNPVFHSLSPRLHNASYRAMGHQALFVPLRVESFAEFWPEFVLSKRLDALGMPINGMTVASPHKEEAVLTAKIVSGMVRQTE